MNVTEPIRRHAFLKPRALAVVLPDGEGVAYAALDRRVDALAAHLARLGATPGLVAGLALTPGPDEFASLAIALALARLGVATADPSLPADDLDLCVPEPGRPGPPGVPALPLDDVWRAVPRSPEVAPPGPIHPDGSTLCRIFGTSGTTGAPKFVPASHDLIARRVLGKFVALGERDDVHICAAGLGGAMGFHDALRTFFAGGTLVFSDPEQVETAIRRHGVNSLLIAPGALRTLVARLRDEDGPLPSLVEVESTGGALPRPLLEAAQRRLCRRIVEVYGATEAHVVASAPADCAAKPSGALGLIHPGVRVEAVDAQGKALPPGETGVLRIGGPFVADGYLGRSDDDPFRDGWFTTSDLGSVSADGWLTLAGRSNEVINVGGIKVSPGMVEDVLLALPAVRDAAAFGVPDALGVAQVWAAVVLEPGADMAPIADACKAKLGARAPRFLVPMEALPRNANGKILRVELTALARKAAGL